MKEFVAYLIGSSFLGACLMIGYAVGMVIGWAVLILVRAVIA